MIKGLKGDLTILNVYVPNNRDLNIRNKTKR